ncbi:MAG: phenylacetate--CoA ligase [Candidatus Obscuribacterales bacterium]|jgi:phenylacetate-CoA ligase
MLTKSEVFMWNQAVESIDRASLEALQLTRLKETLRQVFTNVPLMRDRFTEAGMTIDKIDALKSVKEIANFPFMKKSDLRDNYPFGLFAKPMKEVNRLHASSGTKGKPTVVGYTKTDIENWAEACARSLACAGTKPSDVLHNSYGYGLFTGGLGMHYGAERLGCTVVPASGGRTQQQIMLLQDFGARILLSTPSYALNMAYTMAEMKIPRDSINLEIGIFGAEPWTEEMRDQLENLLQIQALDIYGLSEVMGPGVSVECVQAKHGLHIWEDLFIAEIIDPISGEVLPDGEEGELVFTTLTKEAIPVIRYRTGDLSTLIVEPCVCGRTMRRMTRVRARLDDMLIIRGVNLYPSEIEKALLSMAELAPHYQLVIDRKKALDSLEIQVEVNEAVIDKWGHFEDGHLDMTDLTEQIQKLLKDSLGLTADVTLLKPRTLARSEGKAVRVVDKRKDT